MLTVFAALLIAGQEPTPPSSADADAARMLFRQTAPHWRLPCDRPEVRRQRIQFDITLDRRGRIIAGPTPVAPRNDPDWQAAAELARRSLLGAAPFDVPPDYPGGSYRPTFHAETACTAADEP